MSALAESEQRMSRTELSGSDCRVLNRGGWGNPDVLLVESPQGQVVVKDFSPRTAFVRRWLAPWLLAREERAYQRLTGVAAVPSLLGRVDREALMIEYRPGTYLSRSLAGKLPAEFLDELAAAIDEMHRRGVLHLDLRHRSNILASEDGHPVVIDFASAIRFDPDTIRGRLTRGLLRWVDRRALAKWRVRLG